MTSNFKEFKVESHANDSWDEHGAMASTAVRSLFDPKFSACHQRTSMKLTLVCMPQDYLAHYDTAAHGGSDIK